MSQHSRNVLASKERRRARGMCGWFGCKRKSLKFYFCLFHREIHNRYYRENNGKEKQKLRPAYIRERLESQKRLS